MSVSSGGGAWSTTDYGRPWSASADVCLHHRSDAVALGMGNTLSYFTGGGGTAAAAETGGAADPAPTATTARRHSLGRRSSAADSRAKKQPQPVAAAAAADGDDNDEFHDSSSYFTDLPPPSAATTSRAAVNGKAGASVGRSAPGETRRDYGGGAPKATSGVSAPAADASGSGARGYRTKSPQLHVAAAPATAALSPQTLPPLAATASDVRADHHFNSNRRDEAGAPLKDRLSAAAAAAPTAHDERSAVASSRVPPTPAPRTSVPRQPPQPPAPRQPPAPTSVVASPPPPPPPIAEYNGGGTGATTSHATASTRLRVACSGGVEDSSSGGGDVKAASSGVAQRSRTACAPTSLLNGIDMDLANIISTVEQLSQKANSPIASSAAAPRKPIASAAASGGSIARSRTGVAGGGGGGPSAPPTPGTPPSLQLSPRDPQSPAVAAAASNGQLAAELRSAIEARVKRSVSLKDQHSHPPVAAGAAAAATAGNRHRRTSSLTHLDDAAAAADQQSAAGTQQQQGSHEMVSPDSEARSRDRRARLLNMERRREQQLSEVRGGGCFSVAPGADIGPVEEDSCADVIQSP